MTTIQPILALRHVYEPAVQLCRTDSVVSAMANSTLGSPHHHLLRKGDACCSQGKVRLPPPPQPNLEYRQLLEGSDSEAKAFRENARSYNNAVPFTSLAAHWDQTQVGTLGPPVFRVLCSNMADRPGRGHRHSTWTRRRRQSHATIYFDKLESILRTGNRFVREFASAKARAGWDTAKEWILRLCLPPGRDRRTHNPPTSSTEMAMLICDSDTNTGDRGPQDLILQVHGDRCPDGRPKYQIVSSLHPSAMPLRYPLLFPAGEDGFHPNIPLCGVPPSQAANRQKLRADRQWRTKTATMRMKTARKGTKRMVMANDEGQVKGSRWRVSRSQFFAHYLPNATSTSQSRIAPNVPSWTIPGCDGVRCQTWKASAAHHDDVRPRLTGNQGCTGADKACNRPDLIARVFEAKSGNKRHAGCFGNECKMNGFCFFATVRLSCYFLNFILPLI
ncbi:BQ5605_C017g08326 [Microbotryum silenes-dioicae]|uniref:BQ5605_C017g08326 protein n=1 Tax=Microbotryum silenes-dioicae TaxID=796604 RepID=A0A2X0LYE1_9BASI|nr:BQ5605_C017g08326 [Microbotryum silenes-dioicae]